MTILQICILAVIQGVAELLPVSSSAHVITAERLMGLDPTLPEMTLLIVMLHTGTMFAVIVFFWNAWRKTFFESKEAVKKYVLYLSSATIATGIIGYGLLLLIKHQFSSDATTFEIEHLFGNAKLMAYALATAGILIIVSSRIREQSKPLTLFSSIVIGSVQGLCLPFRGFSRSGATISTGLLCGVSRARAEEFSFALAVILTPAVIVKEAFRLLKVKTELSATQWEHMLNIFTPSLIGMVLSFVFGLIALHWLSRWLQKDRWHFFGGYCLVAACVVYLTA